MATLPAKATRHRADKLPKQPGEIARLRVRKGSDTGVTFALFGLPVSIGRGEENEVVLADLKASRKHATIAKEVKGRYYIQDNGSANGIQYKDKAERQFLIQHGAVFSVGETELEFLFADLMPELQPKGRGAALPAPVNPLTGLVMASNAPAPSALNALAFPSASGLGMANPAPRSAPSPVNYASPAGANSTEASAKKKKNLIIAAVAIGAGVLYFGNEEAKKVPKAPKAAVAKRDLASLLPPDEGAHVNAADSIFRAGFREYREKNYLRAKTLFETVLQVSPGHILAEKYLQDAEHAITDDIRFQLKKGREELNTGRLKNAKGHYEAVLRLLRRTPTAPEANEARDQLDVINAKLKGVTG